MGKYQATIDCRNRKMVFQPDGIESFKYVDTSCKPRRMMISSLEAMKLISSGCIGYLAYVIDVIEKKKLQLEDVLVVHEFFDVFPEELPIVPPACEISFEIELMSRTTSISKAPYQMALVELKELQVQLKELLDKGFIRPSY